MNKMIAVVLLFSGFAVAKNKDNGRPPCATTYSIVQEDTLGNVQQGISNSKNLKWADKDLEKKYPAVCYIAPDPSVKTAFVITDVSWNKGCDEYRDDTHIRNCHRHVHG